MKIGDEVYIHGYIDEIRSDVVIIRNEGGYFGTVPSEIKPKTEPQHDYEPAEPFEWSEYIKDIEDEPQTDYTPDCPFCRKYRTEDCLGSDCRHYKTYKGEPQTDGYMTAEQTEDYRKMLDKAVYDKWGNVFDARADIEDEPQKIGYCNECKWFRDKQVCGRCRSKNMYAPKTEPQTCANGCKWLDQDGECTEPNGECHIEYRTQVDEPQKCYLRESCDHYGDKQVCGRCREYNLYSHTKTDPQTDYLKKLKALQEYLGIKREPTLPEIVEGEPQTERRER